jgi:hypothetical protein
MQLGGARQILPVGTYTVRPEQSHRDVRRRLGVCRRLGGRWRLHRRLGVCLGGRRRLGIGRRLGVAEDFRDTRTFVRLGVDKYLSEGARFLNNTVLCFVLQTGWAFRSASRWSTTAVLGRHLDSKKRSVFLWVYLLHVSDDRKCFRKFVASRRS